MFVRVLLASVVLAFVALVGLGVYVRFFVGLPPTPVGYDPSLRGVDDAIRRELVDDHAALGCPQELSWHLDAYLQGDANRLVDRVQAANRYTVSVDRLERGGFDVIAREYVTPTKRNLAEAVDHMRPLANAPEATYRGWTVSLRTTCPRNS